MNSLKWKEAQKSVADFLREYNFSVEEEVRLPSGGRIDILALKKMPNYFLHLIVEVKDWNKVTRKKEAEFCQQVIRYLVEYSLKETLGRVTKDKWNRSDKKLTDQYLGLLCLTKDTHFSYRKISDHYMRKNDHIQGIPLREQAVERTKIFVARFDFISKVFEELQIPLYKESSIDEWF